MSAIPPNWLGSIIQSQGAQERAGQAKAAEDAANAKGTERGRFSSELQDIIESSDADSEVYSDAEGAGSQGSPFSEAEEEEVEETEEEPRDPLDGGSLDLEA